MVSGVLMVLFLSPPCLAKTPSKGRGRKIKEYKEFREFREDKDVNAKLPKLSKLPISTSPHQHHDQFLVRVDADGCKLSLAPLHNLLSEGVRFDLSQKKTPRDSTN